MLLDNSFYLLCSVVTVAFVALVWRHETLVWLRTFLIVNIIDDGVAPYPIAGAQQVQTVVGEVLAKFAVLVNKERVEVNPCHSLSLGGFFHSAVAVDNHLFAVFKQFPHLHVGVEREHRLQVNFSPRATLLDEDYEFLHYTTNAVAINAVRHIVYTAQDENLAGMPFEDGFHALIKSLHDVANDAAVFHVWVAKKFVPLSAVGETVAEHDDIAGINWQVVKVSSSTHIVLVLVGGALGCLRLHCRDNGNYRNK